MKYISFVVPCYNSEAYMEHAIESILTGGEDVEILIVNDGSKDSTGEIAKKYQQKFPTIIKAIDKENGGHGDAVNTGLKYATGLYFKVVDSDDWVEEASLQKILATLHRL
ncbi:MAG: glycosyltransferase family A protein, partial [Lachnospiraceae bacterium]